MKYEFKPPPAVETYGKAGKAKYFAKLLKVGAANEVAEVYTLNRAYIVTASATRARGVVDGSKIVFYLDCSLGAGFLTLAAGDTTVEANLANLSTLVVTRALNDNTRGVVDKVNDVVGTSLCAKSAADALAGVDFRNSLLGIDANSIAGANLHTIAVAKTSEGAIAVARVGHICRGTGLNSVVNVLALGGVAGAVAGNVRYLLNYVTGSKTHNLANLGSDTVTTGNAKAGIIGFALGESLCVAVAAGEAAGTAVSTGKAITDSSRTLVLLDSEEYRRNGKHQSANYRYNH